MPVARVVMSTSLSSRPSPRVYGAPWRLHSGKGLSPRSGRFGVDDGDGAAGYAGRLAVLVRYVDLPRLARAPQVSRDVECHRPLRRELRELRTEVARDAFVVPYRVFQVQTLYFLAAPTNPRILAHRPGRTATGSSPSRSSPSRRRVEPRRCAARRGNRAARRT